ncbi:MAG: TrmH family RNA methyltransferase [Candidatus Promineifilaceae bacterium]|jgi:TrmH family RNA methyltransferase
MISSLSNAQVKHVRRLQNDRRYRHKKQRFVVEGARMLAELISCRDRLDVTYYTQDWLADRRHEELLEEIDGRAVAVAPEVLAAMSDTETAPGVLAVVRIDERPLPQRPSFVLILDGLATPGNLGTILRTAGATAVDAVLLSSGSVDIYNPKVVRGAMGAHLRVPVRRFTWAEIAAYTAGLAVWTAEARGEQNYAQIDWRQPSALIIGNEAHGAGAEAQALARGSAVIPMAAATESLNAATAAAVILFEAYRQRGFLGLEGTKV